MSMRGQSQIAIGDFAGLSHRTATLVMMALNPFAKKWESFGWEAFEINGHDMKALLDALTPLPKKTGKPTAIIANTIKGKGVSFMEDDNNWHYRSPDAEEVIKAKKELGLV